MRIAPLGSDVRFDETQIEEGRNFANKLWNACRFRQMQEGVEPAAELDPEQLSIFDIDILAKLDQLAADLDKAYADYRFNDIAQLLYEFFWSDFCDWYLESVKRDFFGESADPAKTAVALKVIDTVFERFLGLMHPFMPHITEELWERMGFAKDGGLLMQTNIPDTLRCCRGSTPTEARERAAAIFEATGRARNLKAEYNLAANKKVSFVLEPAADWVAAETETLRALVGAREIAVNPGFLPAANTPALIASIGKMHMPIEGLIDVDAEKTRLTKERDKAEKELQKVCAKLNDPNFTERAKKEIVEENKKRRQEFKARLTQLEEMLANLS